MHLLTYLLLLQIALLLLETAVLCAAHPQYLAAALIAHRSIKAPLYLWINLASFICIEIILNIILILFIFFITNTILKNYNYKKIPELFWLSCNFTILLANQLIYPGAAMAELTRLFISQSLAWILLTLFLLINLLIITVFFKILILKIYNNYKKYKKIFLFIMVILFLLLLSILITNFIDHSKPNIFIKNNNKNNNINVFIVGIDALRPDHVGLYGDHTNPTPDLDRWLKQGVNFTQAITPIARTYPAWVSILTGLYPIDHQARFNLVPIKNNIKHNTLASILKNNNYWTAFAIDGREFAHIDQSFGFDKIIAPPDTASSFLITALSDYPLSNLLTNIFLGKSLFPYSYANRDAVITYQPKSFLKLVESSLLNNYKKNNHKPVFLAIHFCLAHWPYTWASYTGENTQNTDQKYRIAIKTVQKQAADFLDFLQKNHFLDQAIVIILSDHGESVGLTGDRLLNQDKFINTVHSHPDIFKLLNQVNTETKSLSISYGHGTDVLSESQYHSVLAILLKNINNKKNTNNFYPGFNHNLISLTAIYPIILDLLNIRNNNYNYKNNKNNKNYIMIESGFSPTSIFSNKISVLDVAFQGSKLFYIDKNTDQLTLKPEIIKILLLKNKQRALYLNHWIFAVYPEKSKNNKNIKFLPILYNRDSHYWTDDLSSNFAKTAPLDFILTTFCEFYRADQLGFRDCE